MLAVDSDPAALEKRTKRYFQQAKYPFVGLMDRERKVAGAYKVEWVPTNYVISPDGKIAARMYGFSESKARRALADK